MVKKSSAKPAFVRGTKISWHQNGRIHTSLEKDYPSETGYLLDNSRQTDNTS